MTEIIIALLSALTGGGLTRLFYWRANRRKVEGEATQTEADALKSIQDVYQQALEDQQNYIAQLRDTRDHLVIDREDLRKENKELRQRLNEMDAKMQQLENDVAKNARMVAATRLWMCGRMNCQQRIAADLGDGDEPVPVIKNTVLRQKKEKEKK